MAVGKFNLIRGRALRATALDGCGRILVGPGSRTATSDGFVSVGMSQNTIQRDSVDVKRPNGHSLVRDTPPPRFLNYSLSITLCGVDPALVTVLSGMPLVLGADGQPNGFRQNSRVPVDLSGFALEVWTGIAGGDCQDGQRQYGYALLPFIKGGTIGDITVENAAVNLTISGATTQEGSAWGKGWTPVLRNALGVPAFLSDRITLGDHLHMEVTTLEPPDPETAATVVPVQPPALYPSDETYPSNNLYPIGA